MTAPLATSHGKSAREYYAATDRKARVLDFLECRAGLVGDGYLVPSRVVGQFNMRRVRVAFDCSLASADVLSRAIALLTFGRGAIQLNQQPIVNIAAESAESGLFFGRMSAGVTKRLWEISDFVDVLEAWEALD